MGNVRAICKLFAERRGSREYPEKAIFLAPAKFLVSQKYESWKPKFQASMQVNVVMLTGDTEISVSDLMAGEDC